MILQTYKGNKFDFRNPVFDIEDIAHALSNLCRYGGHTKKYYSVAEHSWWCAYYMLEFNPKYALDALMHDATEAYLVDIPRPIKQALPEYKRLEDTLYAYLAKAYTLNYPMSYVIKEMDERMLASESWTVLEGGRAFEWDFGGSDNIINGFMPNFWSPQIAEIKFLEMFDELTQT